MLFNLDVDAVRIYRRAVDDFVRAIELTLEANDLLTTPFLPGLEMSLSRFFCE